MSLTTAQATALATAIKASTDPVVVAALAIRDDVTLANWCNSASTTDAWDEAKDGSGMFEATNITQFDGLSAGKRDAWRLMVDKAPINFRQVKMRNAVVDIWGVANSVAILTDMLIKATNAEVALGGSNATTNTVTGLRRNFVGQVSIFDVGDALNRNP